MRAGGEHAGTVHHVRDGEGVRPHRRLLRRGQDPQLRRRHHRRPPDHLRLPQAADQRHGRPEARPRRRHPLQVRRQHPLRHQPFHRLLQGALMSGSTSTSDATIIKERSIHRSPALISRLLCACAVVNDRARNIYACCSFVVLLPAYLLRFDS
uniref:Expressed protein n=2 Tax=Oryza TaxID=4527 RepID=Q2RBD9_ORYSJ|nr:expressed protein [Oryza sativa Japonica Group]BAG88824.1 unnamed protein product [Oryza sativa Japonica Group]